MISRIQLMQAVMKLDALLPVHPECGNYRVQIATWFNNALTFTLMQKFSFIPLSLYPSIPVSLYFLSSGYRLSIKDQKVSSSPVLYPQKLLLLIFSSPTIICTAMAQTQLLENKFNFNSSIYYRHL